MESKIFDKKTNALIFPGQGSQAVLMGKDIYDNFKSGREVFEQVDEILGRSLSKIMFEGPNEELVKTENAQPALMTVSVAIMKVIEKEFGKKASDLASVAAGHSLGEYSALCAIGALDLEQTTKLLDIRGSSMANCANKNPGLMAAVLGADMNIVEDLVSQSGVEGEVCQVANDNSLGQVVISGSKSAIDRSVEIAKKLGVKRVVILPVAGAFHSPLMQDAANTMKEQLMLAKINSPQIPIISNVSAKSITDPEEIRKNLIDQITGRVRWRETSILMESSGIKSAVEVGSGKVLCGLVSKTCPSIETRSIQASLDITSYFS